jgi:MarR family transcriptional regulator for hemolysin
MDTSRNTLVVPAVERATHAIALWVDRTLGDLRLTQAEAHVLGYLAGVGQCAINELHASFGHRRSTLTSVLDRLEARHLIRRGPHPTSRRLVLVQLTDAGRPVAERVGAALQQIDALLAQRVGRADVETFLRVIRALEESIE